MKKVTVALASAVLASCARGSVAPLPLAQLVQPLAGFSYRLIYSFTGAGDGGYPYASLTPLDGELYGTTYGGGESQGWGTVFKIGPAGEQSAIYKFKAGNDGAHPWGGLVALNGTLYGLTYQGGTAGYGTVYKISPTGEEHVLYSFEDGTDGGYPYGNLVALNGALYGTTYGGGNPTGWGVVFKVSTTGSEHVLHKFAAGDDGAHPTAGPIVYNGVLYGTTSQGGGPKGSGCVYKITPAGEEHVIYGFKGGTDGQYPYGPLVELNGVLFGMTYQGGGAGGWGTVFKLTPDGKESVLHRFKAGSDGAHPYYGGLIAVKQTLYGATYQGGTNGWGTLFSVGTAGTEHVLYSFKGKPDGGYPYGGLAELNGTLYGTTAQGGKSNAGSVFKFSP